MRDDLRICVQLLAGESGELHPLLERWWDDIERQYKTCGCQRIPADHIPLWFHRMVDAKLPIAAPKKGESPAEELVKRGPGRPRLQSIGA